MDGNSNHNSNLDLGQKLFQLRDYTPIPLILILFFVQKPTILLAIFGTMLIGLGELFRVYSVAYIGSISRTRSHNTGDNLIDQGPFSWMRNPLYVGNFLILFGFSLFSGHVWFMILSVLLFAIQYYFIVQYEESILREKFAEKYVEYCQKVPAWIPKKCPNLSEIPWPDTFSMALKSEKRTLTSIFVLLILIGFIG